MKPETIQKLKENVPELNELIAFLQSEADKLDTLEPHAGLHDPVQMSVNVRACIQAKATIDAMLAPLLETVDKPAGVNPEEFVV